MSIKTTAIVLAGGKGRRMNSDRPKQYMELLGRPVLYYSLMAFEKSNADEIVIVVGGGDEDYVRHGIVDRFGFAKVRVITEGGKERVDSVYQGALKASNDYILIHDGARPLIRPEIINKAIDRLEECGAVVVGVRSKDTVKLADENGRITATPCRDNTWIAQTPQCFRREDLLEASARREALLKNGEEYVPTDDAMLLSQMLGIQPVMLEGDYSNMKITTPEDIALAERFLSTLE